MPIYRIADLNIHYTPTNPDIAAWLSPYQSNATTADMHITLASSDIAAEGALSPNANEAAALQRVLHRRFPAERRLLMHAAGVIYHGRAYIFTAPSGTGKTTHAMLWQQLPNEQACVLNGDKIILRIHANGVTAYGTPWTGKEGLGVSASCPLGGVFILSRSEQASCSPLSPTAALPHLLSATGFPPTLNERLTVLQLLDELSQIVPLYHLQATPSIDTVHAVLSHIGGHHED